MVKKILIAILLLFVSVVIALKLIEINYRPTWGKLIQIDDTTKGMSITLNNENKDQYVWGIRLLITGYIDGVVTIQQSYIEKDKTNVLYTDKIGKGKVVLSLDRDWYTDQCLINYEPQNVKSGNLQIRYEFKSMPNSNK